MVFFVHEIDLPGLKTKGLGCPCFHEEFSDSTQDRLRKLVEDGAKPGTLLLADTQSKGRGRYGHLWSQIPGRQLLFSLYLSVDLQPSKLPLLNFLAAAGLLDVLDGLSLRESKIKWPNDLLLNGKKLGGVLSEALSMEQGANANIILGVGVNLEGRKEEMPPEIKNLATTLSLHGVNVERLDFLSSFLGKFETRLEQFFQEGPQPIVDLFAERWAYHGEDIEIHQGDKILRGRASQIDENGALLLNTEDSRTVRIVTGDLRLV